MIAVDFLAPGITMLLARRNLNLNFIFIFLSTDCVQSLTPAQSEQHFSGVVLHRRAPALISLQSPRKQKDEEFCDVTSKIGFQRICCDKSLIKLCLFFCSLCLQQHSILRPDVPRRTDCNKWKYPIVQAPGRTHTHLSLCHDHGVRKYEHKNSC